MKQISNQREKLYEKLSEIHRKIDEIRRTDELEIRNQADWRECYVAGIQDMREYLTIEGLKEGIKKSEYLLKSLENLVKNF